ncbi:hepatic and glial cell adhesion molecule-like isoform X2 [Ascaphus truei]|uniref:hepatic and glial cell adhesion molecule-like isoform X2 n=1 Tax=Ascaphus truei TaxID=8439 RepID=UPI003F59375A
MRAAVTALCCCCLGIAALSGVTAEIYLHASVSGCVTFPFNITVSADGPVRCYYETTMLFHYHVGDRDAKFIDQYTNRTECDTSQGRFTLHHVTKADGGWYRCELWRNGESQRAHLTVQDPISAAITSNSSQLGSDIQLTCHFLGDNVTVRWLKDGTRVPSTYVLGEGNRTLLIPTAGREDDGRYSCLLQNSVSNSSAEYHLQPKGSRDVRIRISIIISAILLCLVIPLLLVCICWRKCVFCCKLGKWQKDEGPAGASLPAM